MATRSRKGCIDCKQAKVKCDEIHPSCGTCARRGRPCKGYDLSNSSNQRANQLKRKSVSRHFEQQRRNSRLDEEETFTPIDYTRHLPSSPISDQPLLGDAQYLSESSPPLQSEFDVSMLQTLGGPSDTLRSMIIEASANSIALLKEPSPWQTNEIMIADKTLIGIYFMRHPPDLVMSNEFVDEMNAAVISLLHENPRAVSDTLSAIGESYMRSTSQDTALVVSSRKSRLLNRLRTVNEDGSSLELIIATLLGLCGVELIDGHSDGRGAPLSRLVDNLALMLQYHLMPAKQLGSVAKYFTRALARQDLLLSLSRMQRMKIDPSVWLDEHSQSRADRVWGYTTTLAPLFTELCALAEDVQSTIDHYSSIGSLDSIVEAEDLLDPRVDLEKRETNIRLQLLAWRPTHDLSLPLQTSRKILLHAHAWRAAALLYLFRLFNRPGSSIEADQVALGMAYDVMIHIYGPGESIKLSLWPLFIAACEMDRQEDRDNAHELFDRICRARPTATGKRTRWFCVNQVWPARDQGRDWDWMQISRQNGNEFVPI